MQFKIIHEDADILVCFKPAGTATQTASLAGQDMVSLLKNYLAKQGSGKDPYLGLIHRLDQPVSGLLVFAKNKKAAASLSKQIQDGCANKDYLALCYGKPAMESGTLKHYVGKDPVSKQAKVISEEAFTAILKQHKASENKSLQYKEAVLDYVVEEERAESSLVRISLHTGRFHQIRSQFSFIGNPLLGDVKYGSIEAIEFSRKAKINQIALCAYKLVLKHPVTKKSMEFTLSEEDLPKWVQKQMKNV